jgi:hypothetical protein
VNSARRDNHGDARFQADIAAQIQALADEITHLNVMVRAGADATLQRRIQLKQRTISRLRLFLPSIPSGNASSAPASTTPDDDCGEARGDAGRILPDMTAHC